MNILKIPKLSLLKYVLTVSNTMTNVLQLDYYKSQSLSLRPQIRSIFKKSFTYVKLFLEFQCICIHLNIKMRKGKKEIIRYAFIQLRQFSWTELAMCGNVNSDPICRWDKKGYKE